MIDKVLLIEDDDITSMIHERILKKHGFAKEVITLQTVGLAFNYLEDIISKKIVDQDHHDPLLPFIFLDLNLPMLNGWDFLEEYSLKYKERLPDLKISILSSTIDPEDYQKAKNYDFIIDFISKPLNKTNLGSLKENKKIKHYFN